jgi:hypothetical protein
MPPVTGQDASPHVERKVRVVDRVDELLEILPSLAKLHLYVQLLNGPSQFLAYGLEDDPLVLGEIGPSARFASGPGKLFHARIR